MCSFLGHPKARQENASMNEMSSCPAVALTRRSMWGSGKLSFEQVLFSSVKSMQTLNFPFFFFTTMTFVSHSGSWTSLINLVSISLCTSSLMIWFHSIPSFHLFYFTSVWLGSLSGCVVTVGSMPSMSLYDHAKQSWLSWRNFINIVRTILLSNEPTLICRPGLAGSIWISSNCSTSNCELLIVPSFASSCYKWLSIFIFIEWR